MFVFYSGEKKRTEEQIAGFRKGTQMRIQGEQTQFVGCV
jgi:hypothetical protein